MSDNYFNDKVVAITGGASGQGLAVARLLSSKGAKISIADIQKGPLQTVQEELNCLTCLTDIRHQDQVEAWISATISQFGRIDCVANLAAVVGKDIMIKRTEEITNEDWQFVIDVNLTGMMNCLRAQIPHLKKGATVVTFASVSGQRGFEMNGAYVASKHGVIGLSKCAAKELGPRGVRLNIVAP